MNNQSTYNHMFHSGLMLLIVLCACSFFELSALGYGLYRLLNLAGGALACAVIAFHAIYDTRQGFPRRFIVPLVFILAGAAAGMFVAAYDHGQSLVITAVAQRALYYYLVYFMLHRLTPRPRSVIQVMYVSAGLFLILYLAQYLAYPRLFFESRVQEARGTIRIFLPGMAFLIAAYFNSLMKYFRRFSLIHMGVVVVALAAIVLQATRQLLAAVALCSIIAFVFGRKIRSRLLIGLFVLIGLIPAYFLAQDTLSGLIDISLKDRTDLSSNIRLKAGRYFLTEFSESIWGHVLGNGEASYSSPYGQKVKALKEQKHLYQSDVGIIGNYSKWGLPFVAGALLIIITIMRSRLSTETDFVKYFLLYVILTMFTGKFAFGDASSIALLAMLMYLVDVDSACSSSRGGHGNKARPRTVPRAR